MEAEGAGRQVSIDTLEMPNKAWRFLKSLKIGKSIGMHDRFRAILRRCSSKDSLDRINCRHQFG
jgi:hypothetical protein